MIPLFTHAKKNSTLPIKKSLHKFGALLMLTPLLLTIITFYASLHSMENNSLNLFSYFNENNVYIYRETINYAKESHNWPLMIQLINVCLPPEVIRKYISPHFAEHISIEYKHQLIADKCLNNHFTLKPIKHNKEWHHVINHDGTYHVVPKTKNEYIAWNATNLSRRHTIKAMPNNNDTHIIERIFTKNNNPRYTLSTSSLYNTEEGNKTIMFIKHKKNNCTMHTPMITQNEMTHYLLSSDCSLIAIGENRKDWNLTIYTTKSSSIDTFSLNGPISTLCSAHHSPMFAAGSSNPYTPNLPNIILIQEHIATHMPGHNATITSLEFSPHDTQLLTCSYNEQNNTSHLLVWNICNLPQCIYGRKWKFRIDKAFFICDGKRILITKDNSPVTLLDAVTGNLINDYETISNNPEKTRLFIDNTQDMLFISIIGKTIKFYNSNSCKYLGQITPSNTSPMSIGLTARKKEIIVVDKDEKISKLKLYNKQDYNEIKFIENHANILQLYTLLTICKNNKGSNKTTSFVETIKSY